MSDSDPSFASSFRWTKVAGTDAVVAPGDRLTLAAHPVSIGLQHVVAMFGATFLVPVLTGFPPATTLLFSGIGTILFLLITRNRLPSYLGSSFAIIAPVTAATASDGKGSALGGLVMVGILLVVIGVIVHVAGIRWIELLMPPIITGTIVAVIGLNLAPTAKTNYEKDALTATVVLVLLIAVLVLFKGLVGRLAIFACVVLGYLLALARGKVETDAIGAASWVGFPDFTTPTLHLSVLPLFIPVVLVLVVENIGHVKSIQNHDRDRLRQADRSRARRRRHRHRPRRQRRRFGDHHLRREHRRDGDEGLLDGRLLDRRHRRGAARTVAEGGRGHRVDPAGCARRRHHRALRPRRHPRRQHLGQQPRRLLQADQPVHRGHPAGDRYRRLQLDHRRSQLRRHRPRCRGRTGHLPRHAHHRRLAWNGHRARRTGHLGERAAH